MLLYNLSDGLVIPACIRSRMESSLPHSQPPCGWAGECAPLVSVCLRNQIKPKAGSGGSGLESVPPTSQPRAPHAVPGAKKLAVMGGGGGGGAPAPHLVRNGELWGFSITCAEHTCVPPSTSSHAVPWPPPPAPELPDLPGSSPSPSALFLPLPGAGGGLADGSPGF